MILKALYDYYQRCKNRLPALGLELKEIGFIIVIDENGNFIRFEDQRIDKQHAQLFLVKKAVGRSSTPIANYLYDNAEYVLGVPEMGNKLIKFKEKIQEVYQNNTDFKDLKALFQFYQLYTEEKLKQMKKDPLWEDIEGNLNKKYSNFSFRIEGDKQIIAEKDELLGLLDKNNKEEDKVCLITGEKDHIVDTTSATMIQGSQATAKLVAFQKKSGYDSYGKEQGKNAPIGEKAEFAYTTALKYMLQSDSRNKFTVGNRTFLFWASNDDDAGKKAEEGVFNLFGIRNDNEDDPNRRIEQVRNVFEAIYSGTIKTTLEDKFFILGLAPNSARIAVTFWSQLPLKEFAGFIFRHFNDMEICGAKKPYYGLRSIISAVTLGGKHTDVTPNLPEAITKSIFQGTPYPYTLYASCIRRIRAEQEIYTTRAAIIKAYLNRFNDNNEIKLKTMLDKENKNQGYLCGRLFAVLDKIQEEANNQNSIRERYLNAASATPAMVFATIMNLSSHHADKLNDGRKIFFEKLKQEIIEKISPEGFPSHLDLQDQGRFFVGFYHQRQQFFTKNDNNND